jgi:ATP-dependent Lhr-like helicase
VVPDHERLLVETWRDELGRTNVIAHCPLGQRANRTWGLALKAVAKREFGQSWSVTASNDVLLMTLAEEDAPPRTEVQASALFSAVTPESLPGLRDALVGGALTGGTAFREAAVCALQVLRASRGQRVPLWLQNYRAQELYEAARHWPDYPVAAEVRRDYLDSSLDIPALEHLLQRIGGGQVRLVYQEVESPSPFAHSLLAHDLYRGGHQMGRDRRAHLLRLHRQVLEQVLTSEQMAELLDSRAIERLERRLLHQSEFTRARSSDELAQVVRTLGDLPAAVEAVAEVVDGDAAALLRPLIDERRVVAVELPDCEQDPVRLVTADRWREYHDAFARGGRTAKLSVLEPQLEEGRIAGFGSAPAAEVIPAKWRKRRPREIARRAVLERYLRCRGPVTLYEIVNYTGWPAGAAEAILEDLVEQGSVARGVYTSGKPRPQWANKANLEEIHRLTMGYLKRELAACAPYEVMDFLTRWQHLHPATRLQGEIGLREVIGQLQGTEAMQGALESEILAGRISDYRPEMLDRLIATGEVCWRRVSTKRLRRGLLTLCFRRDMEWLASGSRLEFDGAATADEDIADTIIAVREFFRDSGPTFFDDVVEATGLKEGAVRRAVFHLAWCGEVTCDAYECVRHADFQTSLSACYDLDSTPRKIARGRMSADRVLRQMDRRKLDPRLGRWSATERLAKPQRPLSRNAVVRRWAEQLLKRWGIVTRDLLACEVSAPTWAALVREFKRLELLGRVSRGYFIESHRGEQYGLPEAIELLRDCRARRGDGRELGYLEDEPLFCLTNRDPANLYAWCLDIVEEGDGVFKPTQRRGNFVARTVVQAGQVILYGGGSGGDVRLLARLDRRQLERCLEALTTDQAGDPVPTTIRRWNGHPVDVSPTADFLYGLGFRFNSRKQMCLPPSRPTRLRPPAWEQEEFLPYYLESPPVQYGKEWLVARAPDAVRGKLRELVEFLESRLPDDCEIEYGEEHLRLAYRGRKCANVYVLRQKIWLRITHRGWVPGIEILPDTDLGSGAFLGQFAKQLGSTTRAIDAKMESRKT